MIVNCYYEYIFLYDDSLEMISSKRTNNFCRICVSRSYSTSNATSGGGREFKFATIQTEFFMFSIAIMLANPYPPQKDDVGVTGEKTWEERDKELRAQAIDLDDYKYASHFQ